MSGPFLSAALRARAARSAGRTALLAVLTLPGLALPSLAWAQSANQKIQSDIFAARTGLPRAWVVSNKPGVVVAIRDRDRLAARAPGDKIRLQGEIVEDEAAERLGYRSMRSVVEVNCGTLRDRVVELEVFASPNLKGVAQKRAVPGGWVQPSQDAYMADVIRTVCRAAPRRAETVAAIEPPPRPAPAPAAPPPAPKPLAREPVTELLQMRAMVAAPEPPPAEPRIPASIEAPITTAQRVPRLPEALAPALPQKSPSPVVVAAPPPAPLVAAPAPAKPKPRPSSPGPVHRAVAGGLSVQIGALDSEADAHRALKTVTGLATGGFTPLIQPFKLGERTYYRALVSGFADRADAQAFCGLVARKGGTCFVR